MADLDIKDAQKVNTLSDTDSITVLVNNLLTLIPAAKLYELLAQKIPNVTYDSNGILNKKDFIANLGIINTGLDDIKYSCIGYSYRENDGSGLNGIFLSLAVSGYVLQIKGEFDNRGLKIRTYNYISKAWSTWKTISLL